MLNLSQHPHAHIFSIYVAVSVPISMNYANRVEPHYIDLDKEVSLEVNICLCIVVFMLFLYSYTPLKLSVPCLSWNGDCVFLINNYIKTSSHMFVI